MSTLKSNMKSLMMSSALRSSLLNTTTAAAIALASISTFAIQAEAQITTAAVKGVVTSGGAPVAGATVVVTHTPSGSKKTLTTGSDGSYGASGLRVGGPYSISVDSNRGKGIVENVFLTLGSVSSIPLAVSADATSFEEIVVTGSALAGGIQMGASTLIGEDRRDGVPATNRDLFEYVKLDPLVTIDPTNSNAISIAGGNNRFNSVTIDGVKQNDDFGLNNNGFPTQRSPISLDAVDQISVSAAPFSVEFGGFQGGNINVVTKSGTNDFHGSAFFTFRNDDLSGNKSKENDVALDFTEKVWGVTLGGPIIKDKLFFFAGFEKFNSSQPNQFGPEGSGLANEVSGITQAQLDEVSQIANDVYGFDAGTTDELTSVPVQDRKIIAKIDWNINEDHRASFTYQNTEGNVINPQGQSTSFGGSLSLPSNWYDKNDKLKSYALHVFSDWSDNFSTEVKISKKEVETLQEPLRGNEFAQMQVDLPSGARIMLGPDQFRHANQLMNDTWNYKIKATYTTGDHEFKVGYEREKIDIFNLFIIAANGRYSFDSIDDFRNRQADDLFYGNATSNVKEDGAAVFDNTVNTIYVEDSWTATEDLTLNFGLRFEWFEASTAPKLNARFVSDYGFNNNETMSGRNLISPRFGFNYVVDERTVIHGGIGRFGGGNPNVWISNNYTNDGITLVNTGTIFSGPTLDNVDGFNIHPDALALISAQAGAGTGPTNYLDPDFKIPSVWKFNLVVDHEFDLGETLGDGYNVSAGFLYTVVDQAAQWEELRADDQVGTAPDGRPIYNKVGRGAYDVGLTNDTRGGAKVFTLALQKRYEGGFDFYGTYTFTDSEDVNPGVSSTATSNFGRIAVSDRQNFSLATSNVEVRHRFVLNMNYIKQFIDGYDSRFSLFLTVKSGRPFSSTYDQASSSLDHPFGGGAEFERRDRQLIYVPTAGDPLMCYTDCTYEDNRGNIVTADSAITEEDFLAFLAETGLDKYAGSIAPRNSQNSPWISRLDFKFSQEIPGIMEGHKGVFTFDIENLTNLLNSNWGRLDQVSFPSLSTVGRVNITDDNRYVFERDNLNAEPWNFNSLPSVWKIRLGVKYEF